MPDPSPSTLTVYTPTSYCSKEGVAAGHSGQFTPGGLPVNTVIHTTLVGLEPATYRLLVRRATSVTDSQCSSQRHNELFWQCY